MILDQIIKQIIISIIKNYCNQFNQNLKCIMYMSLIKNLLNKVLILRINNKIIRGIILKKFLHFKNLINIIIKMDQITLVRILKKVKVIRN